MSAIATRSLPHISKYSRMVDRRCVWYESSTNDNPHSDLTQSTDVWNLSARVVHSGGGPFLRICCTRCASPYSRATLTRLLRGRRFNFVKDCRCMVRQTINYTPYSPTPTRHRAWQGHVNLNIIPFLPPLLPIRITLAERV